MQLITSYYVDNTKTIKQTSKRIRASVKQLLNPFAYDQLITSDLAKSLSLIQHSGVEKKPLAFRLWPCGRTLFNYQVNFLLAKLDPPPVSRRDCSLILAYLP